MNESVPLQNIEAESKRTEAYQRIEMLTSDIVFDHEEQDIRFQLDTDPLVGQYAELFKFELQTTDDMYDALRNGNSKRGNELQAKVFEISDQRKAMPQEVARKYDNLRAQLDSISSPYRTRRLAAGSFEADAVEKIINNAPRPQHIDTQNAPAKNYASNSEEAWAHMPDEAVREYLGARTFFDTDYRKLGVAETPHLLIDAEPGVPLEIPLDLIVNAAGFDSWLGRMGQGSGKDVSGKYAKAYDRKISSLGVGKHYASLPPGESKSSKLPRVGRIDLYIQPNGLIFGDNHEGDSHRILAAILRGDKTIKADHVSICCVDQNWLEAAEQTSEAISSEMENVGKSVDIETQLNQDSRSSQTSNGHEIAHPREILSFDELQDMLKVYGLDGETAQDRARSLRAMSSEALALFMTDINARLNGSEESLIHEKTMKIGGKPTIAPKERYELFSRIIAKIKATPEEINPARLGDALALTTVLLHLFKDGNGRTARMFGYIFRDVMTGQNGQKDFTVRVEPRDKARERGGFLINGYIPYMGEGVDHSDPDQIYEYINKVLTLKGQDGSLYTSAYGQAELTESVK